MSEDFIDPNATDSEHRPYVVVKFKEEQPILDDIYNNLYDVVFGTSDSDVDAVIANLPPLLDWREIVHMFPELMFERVFRSLTLQDLEEARDEVASDPPNAGGVSEIPFLETYFRFDSSAPLEDNVDLEPLAKYLRDRETTVELAYVARPIGPPPQAGAYYQGYFERPDNGGVGFRYVKDEYPPASGANVRFVDVEQGWIYVHPDLPALPNPIPLSGVNCGVPGPAFRPGTGPHGLMILGILLAQDDGVGITGIVPDATAWLASELRKNGKDYDIENTPDAIIAATKRLNKGDVILIEGQQNFDGKEVKFAGQQDVTRRFNLPVEADPTIFAAIVYATSRGLIVVEPAGFNLPNGVSLDNVTFTISGHPPLFSSDSGAIVVAAGWNNVMDPTFSRADTTNYGNGVDCFADGDYIASLNDGGPANLYQIVTYGGNSSAAAIVAGAALILQDIQTAGLIKPWKMRDLLTTPGTSPNPTGTGANPLIGVMPNMLAIEAKHGPLNTLA
jgi:hypothetical protein